MQTPFSTPEREAFRDTVRRYVEQTLRPNAAEWDEAGAFPWSVHEQMGEMGLFGFGVSEDYGGLGSEDAFLRAIAFEELGRCGATGILASCGSRLISIGPIQQLASDAIKQRALAEIVSGRKSSALAITEPSGGSDVANLQTRAVRDGDHYVLNGSKTFITGGLKSDYFVVGARTGEPGLAGISLFFVDWGTPGFTRSSVGKKMGWWASDTASLYFDDVRVPADQMLGEENRGFLSIMNNFNHERLGMAAQCVGMMRVCLEESIAYAQQRQTFGKPLIRHQVIRHKIAEMSARIDMIGAYVDRVCWQLNAGEQPVAEICKLKFSATKALEFCASEAMQILGGAGYLRGGPVERVYREVKVMAIGGGSEEIMRDLAVRQMGL